MVLESDQMAGQEYDFIVVGSGGGSMCAALAARAAGKSVLILEKTNYIGGTTSRSGGAMWMPNNHFLKEDGIEDSPEKALTYMNAVIGDQYEDVKGSTPERRRAYIDLAPEMLKFLIGQGIKFHRYPYWPDYYDTYPGGMEEGRVVIADLFDVNSLGEHSHLLRPNYVSLPASLEEVMKAPLVKRTWKGKVATVKIGLRMYTQRLLGKSYTGGGAALQGRMLKRALEARVDVKANAAVTKLLTDGNGRVTGVEATLDGAVHRFTSTSGVLVNAGGFSRNQAMRDKYQPNTRSDWSIVCDGDTGEMIEDMIRLGADIAQMDEMVGVQLTLPPDDREIFPQVMPELAKPHSFIVDQSGERYAREAQSYQDFVHDMFARDKVSPAIPSWLVMDSVYVSRYMVSENMPWAAIPQQWFDTGFVVKADSLSELAQKCGMNPETLDRTAQRFNAFVRDGVDRDFGRGGSAYDNFYADPTQKPVPTLGTVASGPFYAYQIVPGDIGTTGGVVTDVHARVLRSDGTAIEGLYATGNSTASVMGRAYPGGGSCVGPSFVWGYAAAKHAFAI